MQQYTEVICLPPSYCTDISPSGVMGPVGISKINVLYRKCAHDMQFTLNIMQCHDVYPKGFNQYDVAEEYNDYLNGLMKIRDNK